MNEQTSQIGACRFLVSHNPVRLYIKKNEELQLTGRRGASGPFQILVQWSSLHTLALRFRQDGSRYP